MINDEEISKDWLMGQLHSLEHQGFRYTVVADIILEKLAFIRAQERKMTIAACAKLVDEWAAKDGEDWSSVKWIAQAIRDLRLD